MAKQAIRSDFIRQRLDRAGKSVGSCCTSNVARIAEISNMTTKNCIVTLPQLKCNEPREGDKDRERRNVRRS